MYSLIRNFLFLFDAERVHYFSMNGLKLMLKTPFLGLVVKKMFRPSSQPVQCCGLTFQNFVGLGAGFDKNAIFLKELEAVGFGFVEVGTITPIPQEGNEKPRLFRLPKDEAIINRMGFNNDGVDAITERLKKWKNKGTKLVVGANIGKNKATPNEDAWKDYETCFLKVHPYADYIVVNVSSPNTPGLRDLQQTNSLKKILSNLVEHNRNLARAKPLFLKLSPDIDRSTLDEIIELCINIRLDGVIISNTTITRSNLKTPAHRINEIGSGGLSGKPLKLISDELVKYVSEKAGNRLCIIASGGIFNAADAVEKMNNGATLVQIWTGFIYRGPGIVKSIVNRHNITNRG